VLYPIYVSQGNACTNEGESGERGKYVDLTLYVLPSPASELEAGFQPNVLRVKSVDPVGMTGTAYIANRGVP
jgi:hypothetical protein